MKTNLLTWEPIGGMIHFLAKIYERLGVNVLHYDYIGYGLVKDTYGSPSEDSTYESIEAAHQFLLEQGFENKDIIIMGTSVGSGPSCHLASKEKGFLGVILECPFMSCIRVVTNNILLRPLDMFVNINKVGKFTCPTFILHGSVDEVIPQEHGKELFENVPKEFQYTPLWIDGANHHDIIDVLSLDAYMKSLSDFIKFCQFNLGGKKLNEQSSTVIQIKDRVDTKADINKPTCKVFVQFLDGSKIKAVFNLKQNIEDVYDYVSESTSLKNSDFYLTKTVCEQSSITHVKLANMKQTIEEAEINNSVIVQKKK